MAKPTAAPTAEPTSESTAGPTAEPSSKPTAAPTSEPTSESTAGPTAEPTGEPTAGPTAVWFAPRPPPCRSRPYFLPQGEAGDDTLNATGTVLALRGGAGADDSCTLDGIRKVEGDGSYYDPYRGCE